MELNRMLQDAGLSRSSCFLSSVIRSRVRGNDISSLIAQKKSEITPSHKPFYNRFVLPQFLADAAILFRELELCKPKVIIACGNGALFALTGKWGIKSWRGSHLRYTFQDGSEAIVIPTYPPSYVLSVWKDRRITVADFRRAKRCFENPPKPKDYNFLLRPSFTSVIQTLQMLMDRVLSRPTKLSVDIETRAGHIACIGIGWSKLDAICIPLMCVENPEGYWLLEEEAAIHFALYKLLTHPNAQVVGQNFLYDMQYFYRHLHYLPKLTRDTMIAQHVMFSNQPKGLDYLSSLYCEEHVYWKDESKNWDPKLGEDQLWAYNCKDCIITYEVDEVQQPAIDAMGLREVHDFQQELVDAVVWTMIRGIRVDKERTGKLAEELMQKISEREAWIYQAIGRELNIRSPAQMKDLFYRELAQKPVISRKTGSPTCDESALEKISAREPLLKPLCNKITELRSLGVFLSTFVSAPLDTDGRMRCYFNIAGTETYRFSSSENAFNSGMNLQNIPKGDEDDSGEGLLPNIRSNFIPDAGYSFFDIDLDSADLRVVVWESDCTEMKQMFAEGLKPYVEVAKEYYRDPSITKHHPSYKLFKALCHGTNYLGTPSGLAGRIGLLTAEVERIQNWYYGKFPQIKLWQDDLKNQVLKRGWIENVFGYRIYVFDRIEGTIFNQMVAWKPQSTVGCLINRGYRNIHKNLPQVQVLLQVHDSLAGQFPTYLGDWALRRITEECSVPLPYDDPLIIPVGIKASTKSWGECG